MTMSVADVKEQVAQALDALSEIELQQVAEYVSFLKFRQLVAPPSVADTAQLAALYAEFAEEDRALAEAGMEEYQDRLHAEDAH
jgi:hypothetical protein